MDAVLLDTDVFSYLMRGGDARAEYYRRWVAEKTIAVSFITVGELLYGAAKKGWSEGKRADLEQRLQAVAVIPFDLEVCRSYAQARLAPQRDHGCAERFMDCRVRAAVRATAADKQPAAL